MCDRDRKSIFSLILLPTPEWLDAGAFVVDVSNGYVTLLEVSENLGV